MALLADPLNGSLLVQLSQGPKRLVELRREIGFAPPSTVRAHLKVLKTGGLAALQERTDSSRIDEWALTKAGSELPVVMAALELWLQKAPNGPLDFGSDAAKMAIKALEGGWSSTLIWALASAPLSLSQLGSRISQVSYPSLERRLSEMRLAGQLQEARGDGHGTPYAVTAWLRESIVPLAAVVRWEQTHFRDDTPAVTRIDAETAFLLALPLLQMPQELKGSCRMGVEEIEEECPLCGVTVNVEKGKAVACTVDLEGRVDASSDGPALAWAQALTDNRIEGLRLNGNRKLAKGLLAGLHGTLFGAATQAPSL